MECSLIAIAHGERIETEYFPKEGEMKTVLLEIEDSKFEQFMVMMDLLKSDVIKRFEIKKENETSAIEEELLEDLKLFKSGQLETIEIGDIEQYIAELKREIA